MDRGLRRRRLHEQKVASQAVLVGIGSMGKPDALDKFWKAVEEGIDEQ